MDILETIQQRDTKMMTGLVHRSYEEKLRGLGLFSSEKKRFQDDLIHAFRDSWWDSTQKMEPDTSQWYSVTEEEAMGTNRNTGKSN